VVAKDSKRGISAINGSVGEDCPDLAPFPHLDLCPQCMSSSSNHIPVEIISRETKYVKISWQQPLSTENSPPQG
jgi:hypothetical protein